VSLDVETQKAVTKLKSVLEEAHIKYVLVGAQVPLFMLMDNSAGSSQPGVRETKDVDAAISVRSWREFDQIKKQLMEHGFVMPPGGPEHRLQLGRGEVDLLPIGGKISNKSRMLWRKSGQSMEITGFAEAFDHAVETEISPGLRVPIAPLWVFVVLKIVAYADGGRRKDAYDTVFVLQEYGAQDGRRFEEIEILPEGMDYEFSGAFLCGYDVAKRARTSTVSNILNHLDQMLTSGEYAPIVDAALREAGRLDDEEYRQTVFKLLTTFRDGLLARQKGRSP
jgi:predicted nucleotidyltransferase